MNYNDKTNSKPGFRCGECTYAGGVCIGESDWAALKACQDQQRNDMMCHSEIGTPYEHYGILLLSRTPMTNMTQVKFFGGSVFRDRGYVSAVVSGMCFLCIA